MPNNQIDLDSLDLPEEDDLENAVLDLEGIQKKLPDFSQEKICEMIVCDRYFGIDQNISIMCMQELSKRREKGSTFDFESYIESTQKELPVLDFSIPDIRTILNQAIGKKGS